MRLIWECVFAKSAETASLVQSSVMSVKVQNFNARGNSPVWQGVPCNHTSQRPWELIDMLEDLCADSFTRALIRDRGKGS